MVYVQGWTSSISSRRNTRNGVLIRVKTHSQPLMVKHSFVRQYANNILKTFPGLQLKLFVV